MKPNLYDIIYFQELNASNPLNKINKAQLLDFSGVLLGLFFVYFSYRNIQIKKNDSYAIIGLMLASIMIYVHSLKFFGLDGLPNREKHINELGKSI